jgi:IS5 family transposase
MLLNAKQTSLLTMMTGCEIASKRTRQRIFLEEMDLVVPLDALVELIAPHHLKSSTGRPPFGIEVLLRIYCLTVVWFIVYECLFLDHGRYR